PRQSPPSPVAEARERQKDCSWSGVNPAVRSPPSIDRSDVSASPLNRACCLANGCKKSGMSTRCVTVWLLDPLPPLIATPPPLPCAANRDAITVVSSRLYTSPRSCPRPPSLGSRVVVPRSSRPTHPDPAPPRAR